MTSEFFTDRWAYLERFGHGKWLKVPLLGQGVTELGALISQIDWAHILPLIGLGITAIGTALIGLWRYYRLTEIEIEIKRKQAEASWRTIITPGVQPLPPEPK